MREDSGGFFRPIVDAMKCALHPAVYHVSMSTGTTIALFYFLFHLSTFPLGRCNFEHEMSEASRGWSQGCFVKGGAVKFQERELTLLLTI